MLTTLAYWIPWQLRGESKVLAQATTNYQGKAQLPLRSQRKVLPTTLDLLHGDRAEQSKHSLRTVTPKAIKHFVAMATHLFPVPTHLISICKLFSARKMLQKPTNSSSHIYMLVGSCISGTIWKYENWTRRVARNAFNVAEVWSQVCCHGNKIVKPKLQSTFSRI